MKMGPSNILEHRKTIESAEGSTLETSPFRECLTKCDTKIININAKDFGGVTDDMAIHIHKVKGVEDKNRPALIYFHGGAFCFFSAKLSAPWACQVAINANATVFGVDYGVAPEIKAPGGGLNCYAATKYITQNAHIFNVDPKRIAIFGESSGGNMTACCSMELAKRSESHLVKFAWMDIAFVSNHWFSRTKENSSEREWVSLEG
jgi:acetyl esterase/lipase